MGDLMNEPALDPPPGVVPNFVDTGGSHAIGYGIVIASSIISTVAVLARLVSSAATKRFVLEDYLLVAALVGNLPQLLQDNKKKKEELNGTIGNLCW